MTEPAFLTLDEVLAIHRDQIRRYGGRPGIRDLNLLASALGAPAASYGGELLHTDLYEMAAAYLFHIARNHPFIDGNKRTALMAALGFLGLNGWTLEADPDILLDRVLGAAEGRISKSEIANLFRERSQARGR